jgi:hypothetical protein
MNEGTRNQLEVKLKKMLDHHDQAKAKQKATNTSTRYRQYYSPQGW